MYTSNRNGSANIIRALPVLTVFYVAHLNKHGRARERQLLGCSQCFPQLHLVQLLAQ